MNRAWVFVVWSLLGTMMLPMSEVLAQRIVPGTGTRIDYVGDDFEDSEWDFVRQGLKSSDENDKQSRYPLGYSVNGRWFEGPERGYPDQLKVIAAPAGGLPGSRYALQIATLHSGVPGYNSHDVQQDDLIVDCISRLGGSIPVSELPNCVVRVYLPPEERWEQRSGPHFGFRLGVTTTTQKPSTGLFARGSEATSEPYWPGMWIHFRKAADRKGDQSDAAFIKVRGDHRGRDFHVRNIPESEFGWWTLGMSVSADGMVHYYASPGVDPLTAADHLTSQYPYGFRAERFRTFFFNICNRNDGQTWSTPFVIDDPQLFLVHASRVASIVQRKEQAQQRHATKSARPDSRRQ